MAYVINYTPLDGRKNRKNRIGGKQMVLLGILVLAVGFVFFGEFRDAFRTFFIPGDPEVTAAAWDAMVSDLQSGSGVGEAVTAFCRQVLEGAAVAG